MKKNRANATGTPSLLRDEATKTWIGTEAIAKQFGFGEDDLIRLPLVFGKRPNEGKNLRNIRGIGFAEGEREEA